MIDHPACSDAELCQRFREGDVAAGNELALRYRRLVKVCMRPYFLAGGDSEDLLQEGMIGLIAAMREYDSSAGASFHTYAELCIRRRIISATRAAARQKHAPLNDGVPLEKFLSGEEHHAALYPGRSAEELVLNAAWKNDLLSVYSRQLSPFESQILSDYLNGLSYAEIAENCGRSQKSVDNAVQRIRKKLARCISITGDIS